MSAPVAYYTAKAVRELDRLAIEQHHIPGFELMQRAGKAAFAALLEQWPETRRLLIFCGTGNNGGDGFVLAALAVEAGLNAEVYLAGKATTIKGAAQQALESAEKAQVLIHHTVEVPTLGAQPAGTVVVDALLGTGLVGEVRAPYRQVIEAINHSDLPVLALDIPSGLCSDTGVVLGVCVRADLTVTFIGRKLGLVAGAGPQMCGEVAFADLGVPAEIYRLVEPATRQ